MRSLGPPFPLSQCLPLLRDRCFEFCTLADKDDQQAWIPQSSTTPDIMISPIVAIYVTTVLEHMAEYILTAVAMTAETEETDYVRIKELFLALVDDMQVGLVFHAMDLRDKMEKRSFPHGYISRSSMLPPPTNSSFPRNSSNSMNPGNNNFLGDIVFDDLELHYDDDDDTSVQRRQTSLSNYSIASNNRQRPLSMMTNSTSQTSFSASSSNKKAYKVFKNDHHHHSASPLGSNSEQPAVYDPDSPTMNFEDLIRSGNTMRVSLTPHRLKSIEVKDQMADDPAPAKPAWKRRSSSVPRMSTSSAGSSSRPQTPTPTSQRHHRSPSPLVTAPINEQQQKPKLNTQRSMSPTPSAANTKTSTTKPDHRFEQPRDAPKPPSTSSSSSDNTTGASKSIEKSLPTPTSSTSSRQSKHRAPIPVPVPVPVPVVETKLAAVKSTLSESTITTTSEHTTTTTSSSISSSTRTSSDVKEVASPTPSATPNKTPTPSTTPNKTPTPSTVRPPTLRRGSLSNRKSRENLRRQREKEAKAGSDTASMTSTNDATTTTKKATRSSKSSNNLTEQQQSSSDSLDSLDATTTTLPPPTTATPQRPSSYVAKRASMAGASRRQSLHESYAIDVSVETTDASTPTVAVTRAPSPAAGTVGNTIKQLDKVVKQKSSTSSITSTTTASRKASLASLSSTSETTLSPPALQQKSASRKSAVLDRVLQFERAYSVDDDSLQQRRASSYIPRRERFMYLQRDPHALEKKPTSTPSTTTTSTVVRPGTSATIAAAAARFAAGVSMAIQTEPEPPALMITDDDGKHHHQHSPTTMMTPNDLSDAVSEHGVVDGDEEWFLPEDEWEDVHEQENAVAEWLLGEA
ncbi:unnamed protein product [Absidia cylindrospora]